MLATSPDAIVEISDDDFNKSVESIMRCEEFKSNFARKLSNRYISRSPSSVSGHEASISRPLDNTQNIKTHVPERIEICTQLSKSASTEQTEEPVKPPDKHNNTNENIRKTEINVLNMEVETLRWQLAQTEANRQMHIALLKQIVTFLNRMKEHFDAEKNEDLLRKNISPRILARSLNFNDFPRAHSVWHVNKNIEYAINPAKKISTRKISKSISNVNGYKDCNGLWSQSKLYLVPEHEASQKISEEMSRLITLANTVLSTKLPDLACACVDKNSEMDLKFIGNKKERPASLNLSNIAMNFILEEGLNTKTEDIKSHNCVTNKITITNGTNSLKHIESTSTTSSDLGEELPEIKIIENDHADNKSGTGSVNGKETQVIGKLNDYNGVSNFIEDESGFSSMSSFQEIGIPLISIIPPSPCKEVGYLEEIPNIIEEKKKWKADTIEMNKQSMKVFWV
ncbi:PREDICTED: uncharacterized protein LOC106113652 [Papilio xuthus]|uniref:Uncharacterized protein LOC106113652 n=1 Tax=Papilio xuthus TaxID=66420 RepID=A0AAJ6YZ96_PAPXU|nr:PREDICTED: uncharacterized protein LOC106113652 [Papilio xuthus]